MGRLEVCALVGLLAIACSSSPKSTGPGTGGTAGGSAGTGGSAGGSGGATGTGGSGGVAMDSGRADEPAEVGGPAPQPDATDTPAMVLDASGDAHVDINAADRPAGDGPAGTAACPPGALLCDDFEKYVVPADLSASYRLIQTAATVRVDVTKPHTGSRGLHITTPLEAPTMGPSSRKARHCFRSRATTFTGA